MTGTFRKKLARKRQHETGERCTTALQWVDANIEDLVAEDYARRQAQRHDERHAVGDTSASVRPASSSATSSTADTKRGIEIYLSASESAPPPDAGPASHSSSPPSTELL